MLWQVLSDIKVKELHDWLTRHKVALTPTTPECAS